MTIASTGISPASSPASLQAARAIKANEAAQQFDVMFFRVLLQSAKWGSGISGGQGAQQAMVGDMLTDCLAQAATRQQQGFGTMLLNRIDQQGKG